MPETKFWSKSSINNLTGDSNSSVNTVKSPKKKSSSGLLKFLAIFGGVLVVLLLTLGLAAYFYLVKPGQTVYNQVKVIKADLGLVQQSMLDRDLVSLDKNLNKSEADLKALRTLRDQNFGWTGGFSYTKPYYQDSEHFINAGLYSIQAVREASTVVRPFADAAGLKVTEDQKPAAKTSLLEAFSTWISVMPKVADDLDGVIAQLDKVGAELKYVDPNRYPEQINKIEIRSNIVRAQTVLSQLDQYAPDLKQALQIIPGLLGVNTGTVGSGEKRYMIIMQNDKEIRATGGFWTNYATFKVKNGLLDSDFTSKDMYSVDNTLDIIDATFTFPRPPLAYAKYLKVERWYARDANYSPDYPTSIDEFMYSYKLAMRIAPLEIKPVDGIFAIDTQVISELLQVTGPVTVNGVVYNSDNVVLELEKIASLELREQANRKGVLGALMQRMLINVFESDKNLWPKLIEKGVDLAMRKHILAYSFDPAAQALMEKYNLAGRIVDPVVGDFSYVVSTNLGGDKTNWFVHKVVTHTLTNENNRWADSVNIKYTYTNPTGDYALFAKRFRDWVRVYAPLGSEQISVTGSLDPATTDQERNKTYFAGNVELGPGESTEITFKYYLPNSVVSGGTYNLYLEKQPGIDTEVHNVVVNGKTTKIDLSMDKQLSISLK